MQELPPMEVWKARSFWYAIATASALIASAFGRDLNATAWADTAMALVPLLGLFMVYWERMKPSKNLRIWNKRLVIRWED